MRALFLTITALALVFLMAAGAQAQPVKGEELLNGRCAACHQRLPSGGLSRISEARKAPEGWDMTIVRMMLIHGVQITADERRALVKHLADVQGLAPAETKDWRYILERQPNIVENPPKTDLDLPTLCARCHSFARFALQRRDEGEWLKLAHFHQGQFPTSEYQYLGRDRNWWEIVSKDVPKQLASLYPLQTDAWEQWKSKPKTDLAGAWSFAGHRPGVGRYTGVATITAKGDDNYAIDLKLTYADGKSAEGKGTGVVYTGYEWRGRLSQGDEKVLQILALSEDGKRLSGRWFLENSDALGGVIDMIRADAGMAVLAVEPPFVKTGQSATLVVHGAGLDKAGNVSLGEGVEVGKTTAQGPDNLRIEVKVAADAASGARALKLGDAEFGGLLTVYQQIESVRVEPGFAIARIGNKDGPIAPVPAQFDAVAYANGLDGKPGTDDDVRIGVVPAKWAVDNLHEAAAAMNDLKYAGKMEENGMFMPAGAGPNPERRYGTNNAGEIKVKATVQDGDKAVEGEARLYVTVQRWNDPPIR